MKFKPNLRLDLSSDATVCTFDGSAPPTSSTWELCTPTAQPSTPGTMPLDFDASLATDAGELTSSAATIPRHLLSTTKAEHYSDFPESLLPALVPSVENMHTNYEYLPSMKMSSQQPVDSSAASESSDIYDTSSQATIEPGFMTITSTHDFSGSGIANSSSSWTCNDNPVTLFSQQKSPHHERDLEPHTIHHFLLGALSSPNKPRADCQMIVNESQSKTSELQLTQVLTSENISADSIDGDVLRSATCKCDYSGCQKRFHHSEHLRRHKQTFHGDVSKRFRCEFCGKDTFNRNDNLKNHRKLHLRPDSRGKIVKFIPEAVGIIEQEERGRKRRAPPKSRTLSNKNDDQ